VTPTVVFVWFEWCTFECFALLHVFARFARATVQGRAGVAWTEHLLHDTISGDVLVFEIYVVYRCSQSCRSAAISSLSLLSRNPFQRSLANRVYASTTHPLLSCNVPTYAVAVMQGSSKQQYQAATISKDVDHFATATNKQHNHNLPCVSTSYT
jgi:hypothetical protein